MYFFSLRKLEEAFRAKPLDEGRTIRYFLALVTLWASILVIDIHVIGFAFCQYEFSAIAFAFGVIIMAVNIVGIYAAYRANGGENSRHFFYRFIPLAWVFAFRVLLPGIFLVFLLMILVNLLFFLLLDHYATDRAAEVIIKSITTIVFAVYWWQVCIHIKKLQYVARMER